MPNRVVNVCERSVAAEPPAVITVPANIPTLILPSLIQPQIPNTNNDFGYEIAARYVFNDTGGKLYYAFGTNTVDNNKNYHGVMADQQMLDCSNCGQSLYVYSVGGGKVAPTIMHRRDLDKHIGIGALPAMRT